MAKLEQLEALYGANVKESNGVRSGDARPPGSATPAPRPARLQGVERPRDAALIELDRIVVDPDQPRKEFTEALMDEMVESLRERGQLQPVRVRWDEGLGKYRLIMGERRFRAASLAGLKALSAVVHEGPLSPAETLEVQVIENTVRDDLKPVEKAAAIRRLIDEFGLTQQEVAARLKMSQPAVAQALSLLDLAPEIRAKVEDGSIARKAAYAIARAGSPEAQREVAAEVERDGLTGPQAAEVVRRKKAEGNGSGKGRGGKKPKKFGTPMTWSDSGYKFSVSCGKGIDPATLREALLRKAEELAGLIAPQ
jgi:ParB family transcriptional regulator, chromosome partitioning protein